jgi:two-component system, sensor histidine kinase and response regulator
MPEMSGYEATELIRAEEQRSRRRRSRIVAMTANALKSTRMRCLQSGMDDFISKPIKPEMLAERLRPWLPD